MRIHKDSDVVKMSYSLRNENERGYAMIELSLLLGAIVIYILTAIFMKKEQVRRLWLCLFLLIMIITVCSVTFMRFDQDGLLANAKEMSELYFVYFIVAVLPAITFINLWMFRSVIWKTICGKDVVLEKDSKTK